MIGITGERLSVLLCCEHLLHHDWMSFVSWYSFQRNLPDAKFSILCTRAGMKYDIFRWTKRAGIQFQISRNSDPMHRLAYAIKKDMVTLPTLIIRPEILCVREFDNDPNYLNGNHHKGSCIFVSEDGASSTYDERLCCEAGENEFCNFVTYEKGWGNFKIDPWVNKSGNPLQRRLKHSEFATGINERRIASIWNGATEVFYCMSRS